MEFAVLRRLRSGEEPQRNLVVSAFLRRKLSAYGADRRLNDTCCRAREILVGKTFVRFSHEFSPCRPCERRARKFKPERLPRFVEPEPDCRRVVGRICERPCVCPVLRRSRFSCRGYRVFFPFRVRVPQFRSVGGGGGERSRFDRVLQKLRHDVCRLRRYYLRRGSLCLLRRADVVLRVQEYVPVPVLDVPDGNRGDFLSPVREYRVCARVLYRADGADAESERIAGDERPRWKLFVGDSEQRDGPFDCGVEPDSVEDFHRRDVHRMRERVPQLYVALPFAAEVLRDVRLSVCGVEYNRRVGDYRARRVFQRVDCRAVVERLERRAGLYSRLNRAYVLVLAVEFASADERRYVSGVVLERDERSFYRRLSYVRFRHRV